MGILNRINTVIKSNLNAAIDAMSDPAKEIDLLISDMADAEKKARQELVSSVAAVKQTQKRCAELEQEGERWYGRAEKAVGAGDDELARDALEEKAKVESRAADTRLVLQEQEVYAQQLKRSLKELQAKLAEITARKGILKEQARTQKRGEGGARGSKALEEFDRLAGRIEALETEVALGEELGDKEASTEAKFARLEQEDPEVEDALAQLKRKMKH